MNDDSQQNDNDELTALISDQAGTSDDAGEQQAVEVSDQEAASEQMAVASEGETAEQLLAASEVESVSAAASLDEEEKKGGSATIVIIIIIGVLFIAGSISWILINRKRNNN